MLNTNFRCELSHEVCRLPGLFCKAKDLSLTIELVISVTSNSINSLDLSMCPFARKSLPIECVPWSDGCQKTG